MTRGVPTPSSPKYMRDSPQSSSHNPEYKNFDGESVLTRGKLQGKTFSEAIKNKKYIEYCRNNAKHFELQALVQFYDKNS